MVKMNRISYTYKSIQQKQKTKKKKNTNNIYNQNFAEIERKKERSIEIKKDTIVSLSLLSKSSQVNQMFSLFLHSFVSLLSVSLSLSLSLLEAL